MPSLVTLVHALAWECPKSTLQASGDCESATHNFPDRQVARR